MTAAASTQPGQGLKQNSAKLNGSKLNGAKLNGAKFNGTKFNGTASVGASAGAQVFQIGPNGGDTLTITTTTVATVAGGLTTAAAASTAAGAIDTALDTITTSRASYGAAMSRFSMAIQNLQITGENQSAARGRIMDADFAAETANLSRSQILQQAGSAMVAQANQLPNQVLALLR